jgi:tetratricopeptide (TPR) repeat protein
MRFEQQIRAAEGYSELGMLAEALAALDEISADARDRPEVLRMRVQIYLQAKDWETGLRLSRQLTDLLPNESHGFIHSAFCLHELRRTAEAETGAMNGPSTLLEESIYYYNLGLLRGGVRNLDQAKGYVQASFRLNKSFREVGTGRILIWHYSRRPWVRVRRRRMNLELLTQRFAENLNGLASWVRRSASGDRRTASELGRVWDSRGSHPWTTKLLC